MDKAEFTSRHEIRRKSTGNEHEIKPASDEYDNSADERAWRHDEKLRCGGKNISACASTDRFVSYWSFTPRD